MERGQKSQMHYSPNLLSSINNAIDNTQMAFLEYQTREFEISKREIEPMAIIFKNRKRNLVAFCHLRNEYRTFRLDRINLFKVNKKSFISREGFDATTYETDDEYFGNTPQ